MKLKKKKTKNLTDLPLESRRFLVMWTSALQRQQATSGFLSIEHGQMTTLFRIFLTSPSSPISTSLHPIMSALPQGPIRSVSPFSVTADSLLQPQFWIRTGMVNT